MYVLGVFRRTALWGILLVILGTISTGNTEIYFSALGYDLVDPFTKIGTFLAVLFKKWVIHDDSKFHNFIVGYRL